MILLCSSSKSRAMILKNHNIDFIQKSVGFDEDSIVATSPKNFVYQATMGKYEIAKRDFGIDMPILVGDTVVTSGGEILRKAKDIDDARRILEIQSGSMTSIISCTIYQSKKKFFLDISSTDYIFDKFDKDKLEEYLQSREWQGKAGACMVEGFCKPYIKEVRGLESNAIGLPIEKLIPFLD